LHLDLFEQPGIEKFFKVGFSKGKGRIAALPFLYFSLTFQPFYNNLI